MSDNISIKRFPNLWILSDDLSQKEYIKNQKLMKQDLLLSKVRELKKISDCENCNMELIKLKINEIISDIEAIGDRK
jgi:uncharacterized protein with PIN domain